MLREPILLHPSMNQQQLKTRFEHQQKIMIQENNSIFDQLKKQYAGEVQSAGLPPVSQDDFVAVDLQKKKVESMAHNNSETRKATLSYYNNV